jgi:hypothetical protein
MFFFAWASADSSAFSSLGRACTAEPWSVNSPYAFTSNVKSGGVRSTQASGFRSEGIA